MPARKSIGSTARKIRLWGVSCSIKASPETSAPGPPPVLPTLERGMHIHAPSGRANSTSVSVGEVVGHGIDGVMSTNAGDVSAPTLTEVACRAIRCFLRSVGLNRRRFATRPLDKTVLKATACSQRPSGMRACPLRRARLQAEQAKKVREQARKEEEVKRLAKPASAQPKQKE